MYAGLNDFQYNSISEGVKTRAKGIFVSFESSFGLEKMELGFLII